ENLRVNGLKNEILNRVRDMVQSDRKREILRSFLSLRMTRNGFPINTFGNNGYPLSPLGEN
ncbi:MAG: hypothetical protein KAJ31_01745, partial [Deltaproteobacteria bacterium]|nr:hypothetical protein [Deltaproteobacteria bacterium]